MVQNTKRHGTFYFFNYPLVSGGMRVKVQQRLIVFQEKGEKGMQTSIHNDMHTFSYIIFHDDKNCMWYFTSLHQFVIIYQLL